MSLHDIYCSWIYQHVRSQEVLRKAGQLLYFSVVTITLKLNKKSAEVRGVVPTSTYSARAYVLLLTDVY